MKKAKREEALKAKVVALILEGCHCNTCWSMKPCIIVPYTEGICSNWETGGTDEVGRLQSAGLRRGRHSS
jgi:hypothetical protein